MLIFRSWKLISAHFCRTSTQKSYFWSEMSHRPTKNWTADGNDKGIACQALVFPNEMVEFESYELADAVGIETGIWISIHIVGVASLSGQQAQILDAGN
jgi:hypothetical protein